MAKMYYSEQEAAEVLGITAEELAAYIRDDKLRVFQDGAKKMFKTEEVDALAGEGEEEIELSPADSAADQVSLSEADEAGAEDEKEDTVLTAEGISIFDDGELEIEVADPMAKTQIAPSLEEQMTMDGVGSGSGLLDLTRESDDTSLGAEVLGHIDMDEGVDTGLSGSVAGQPGIGVPPSPVPTPVVVAAPADEMDAASGLFGGIVIGCTLIFIVIGAVVLAASRHALPPYLKSMRNQVGLVVGAAVAIIVIVAIIGMVIGKSAATRRAISRLGG